MMKLRSCPSCGSKKIGQVRQDWIGEFQGQTYTVPKLEFHECPACGEKVYGREAMQRIEASSPAFVRTTKTKTQVLKGKGRSSRQAA